MTKKLKFQFIKSLIPCILITISLGFCYAFSLFIPEIKECTNASLVSIQGIFCINIFFLGLGAAIFGTLAERNIKIASLLSTILLFLGLLISSLGCYLGNIYLLYLGSGLCCGLAEGIGYVTPVKNLLLWFNNSKFKGFITSISIISFGLGSSVCSIIYKCLHSLGCNISEVYLILSFVYFIPMVIGSILIAKPKYTKRLLKLKSKTFNIFKFILTDKFFKTSWLFMFLNISMGLIFIGSCRLLLQNPAIDYSLNSIIIIMSLCGIFNGSGRLLFPFISDYLNSRVNIWIIILTIELLLILPTIIFPLWIPIAIILLNTTYGAGFATLPSVLYDKYGKQSLSEIHGLVLSAWGFASLFAYVINSLCLNICPIEYYLVTVCLMIFIGYLVNFIQLKFRLKYD